MNFIHICFGNSFMTWIPVFFGVWKSSLLLKDFFTISKDDSVFNIWRRGMKLKEVDLG